MRKQLVHIHTLTFLIVAMSFNAVTAADDELLPEFDCVIEPSEIVDLGTAVPGVIGAIYAERSDSVQKGDIVAELESSVEIATLNLSKARAQLNTSIRLRQESAAFGARTRERNEVLFQKSSISEQAIDKLETENRIAELQVNQERDNKKIATLEYRRAQVLLDRHLIRTPFEGVVMERFKSVGEYIEDDPVLRVARLDPLNVEVILPVEYMGRLAIGLHAEVTPDLPGFAGHIATLTLIDKVADAASGTFGVRLSMPNPGHMVPSGLRCRLAFLSPEESANMHSVVDMPAALSPAPEIEESRPLEFEKTARVVLEAQELFNVSSEEQPPAPSLRAERIVILSRMLPSSDQAVIVVAESDQFPENEALISPGAFFNHARECYRVGPFSNEISASRLLETLTSVDVASSSLDIEINQRPSKYIVMTRKQAGRTPKELEKQFRKSGVKDLYLVRSGQNKGRISLGIYNGPVSAGRRRDSLNSIGIDLEVVEVNRDLSTVWVSMALNSAPGSRMELQSTLAEVEPEAGVQSAECDQQHIAQSNKNNI